MKVPEGLKEITKRVACIWVRNVGTAKLGCIRCGLKTKKVAGEMGNNIKYVGSAAIRCRNDLYFQLATIGTGFSLYDARKSSQKSDRAVEELRAILVAMGIYSTSRINVLRVIFSGWEDRSEEERAKIMQLLKFMSGDPDLTPEVEYSALTKKLVALKGMDLKEEKCRMVKKLLGVFADNGALVEKIMLFVGCDDISRRAPKRLGRQSDANIEPQEELTIDT